MAKVAVIMAMGCEEGEALTIVDILRSFGSGIDDQIRTEREQAGEREEVRG